MKLSELCQVGSIHKSNNCGTFKVIEYNGSMNVLIEFTETKYMSTVEAGSIKSGSIRDPLFPSVYGVGFTGIGNHKVKINGSKSRKYDTWHDMLRRCYSEEYQAKKPTYVCCTVCDEWHNFQNFAEWYDENYPRDGARYELDKDIKVDGNKVYGPKLCMFVTREKNIEKARAKKFKFKDPFGNIVKIYNLSNFCKINGLGSSNMNAVYKGRRKSHKGWTRA